MLCYNRFQHWVVLDSARTDNRWFQKLNLFRSRSPIFAVLCKKISSLGLCSLLGFAMWSGISQEAKHKQRQGEIFLFEMSIERSRNGVSTPLNDHMATWFRFRCIGTEETLFPDSSGFWSHQKLEEKQLDKRWFSRGLKKSSYENLNILAGEDACKDLYYPQS
jgi:hypothetical protein